LGPEVFVFENVPGLRSAGGGKYLADIELAINGAGYEMSVQEQYMPDY
jgi:DNA (cytosine-5)-methyltransferase 1